MITHKYCLQQAAWWQRQAALEYEEKQAQESHLSLPPTETQAREGIARCQRRHRIAANTARDYLWMSQCLREETSC